MRVYEYKQYRNGRVSLRFGQPIRRAVECNLVEEDEREVDFQGDCLFFEISPYEIIPAPVGGDRPLEAGSPSTRSSSPRH